MLRRFVSLLVLVGFVTSSVITPSYAQALVMPAPGSMVAPSDSLVPVLIKGLKVHPDNPLLFDFILDTGRSGLKTDSAAFKDESQKLIKYFLAALTIKEDDLWVNLSPYEKERMLTQELGQTELGRDLLAQDYLLKQFTASLIYPEKDLGQKFWDRVYAAAREKFGTTDVQVDTFNKVWIMADYARVLERNEAAYVVDARLKVMLEADYLAEEKAGAQEASDDLSKQVMREIVIPEIEKEVNEGANFAPLRQMFYSMILATWYKQALKDALLNQVYTDKGKVNGMRSAGDLTPEQIYERYLEAYKKGVFNYIKEEDNATVPHKYFSGGVAPNFAMKQRMTTEKAPRFGDKLSTGDLAMARAGVHKAGLSRAQAELLFEEFREQALFRELAQKSAGRSRRLTVAEEAIAQKRFDDEQAAFYEGEDPAIALEEIENDKFSGRRVDDAQVIDQKLAPGSDIALSRRAKELSDFSFEYRYRGEGWQLPHVSIKVFDDDGRYCAVVNDLKPVYLTGDRGILAKILADVKEQNSEKYLMTFSINDAEKRVRADLQGLAASLDKAMNARNPFSNTVVNNGTISFGKRSFETEKIRLAVNHILANQLRIQRDKNQTEMIDLAPVYPELRREINFLQGSIVGATRLIKEPLQMGDVVTVGLKDPTGEVRLVQTAYEIGAWLRKLRRTIRQSHASPVQHSADEAMTRALPAVTSIDRKGDNLDAMLANGWLLIGKFWPKQKITAFQLKGPLSDDPVIIGREGNLIGDFEANPALVLESLVGGNFDWAMGNGHDLDAETLASAEAHGLNMGRLMIDFGNINGGRGHFREYVKTRIAERVVQNEYAKGIFSKLYTPKEVEIAVNHFYRWTAPLDSVRALMNLGWKRQPAQWMLDSFVLVGEFQLNLIDGLLLRESLTEIRDNLSKLEGGSLQGDVEKETLIAIRAVELHKAWETAGIYQISDEAQSSDSVQHIFKIDENNSEVYFADGTVLKANYWGGVKNVTVLTLRLMHQEPRYQDVEGNITALTKEKATQLRNKMSGVDGAQASLPVRVSFPDNFTYIKQPPVWINTPNQSVSVHLGRANGDESTVWAALWLRQKPYIEQKLVFVQMPVSEQVAQAIVLQLPSMKPEEDVENMPETYLEILLKSIRQAVPSAFEGQTAAALLAAADKAMSIDRPTGEEGWVRDADEPFVSPQSENPTGEEARSFVSSPIREDDVPKSTDSWSRPGVPGEDMDSAMVHGGIDLNGNKMGLDVDRKGKGVEMTIAPALLEEFRKGDFTGLEAVIFQIIPLTSPLPILGFSIDGSELKQAGVDDGLQLSVAVRERQDV